MSKTSFNIDIDDIVYTMTISISTFINCRTNYNVDITISYIT